MDAADVCFAAGHGKKASPSNLHDHSKMFFGPAILYRAVSIITALCAVWQFGLNAKCLAKCAFKTACGMPVA